MHKSRGYQLLSDIFLKKRVYGWLNNTGRLDSGRWLNDSFDTWQSRDNLIVICRRGPGDLARSFAAGQAIFALDLNPWKYEVWALSGDSGMLE